MERASLSARINAVAGADGVAGFVASIETDRPFLPQSAILIAKRAVIFVESSRPDRAGGLSVAGVSGLPGIS
jgi:hypothetical protein